MPKGVTISTLTAYRNAKIDIIQPHSGRIVDSLGDNILKESSS
jgi:hypothetical protein